MKLKHTANNRGMELGSIDGARTVDGARNVDGPSCHIYFTCTTRFARSANELRSAERWS